MERERGRGTWAVAVTVAIGAVTLAGSAYAAASGVSKPDLVPMLPTSRPSGTAIPSVYVDSHTQPGHVLYRFDAVIKNEGGAMDIFMKDGIAYQAEWPGGVPQDPDPNKPPASTATVLDRSSSGATFIYSSAPGHNHWHFQNAARYDLLLHGHGKRTSAKIGFCMFDTWKTDVPGSPRYFPTYFKGSGPFSWCAHGHPEVTFTREGISPHWGDLYGAQTSWQWVDVSGLRPGTYSLRATVNPAGYLDESDPSNNTVTVDRVIPGVVAPSRSKTVPAGGSVRFGVGARIISPGIPAVRDPQTCNPKTDTSCYVTTTADGPLRFAVVNGPSHGTLTMLSHTDRHARFKYVPVAGYHGTDSFTYSATDARELVSRPASFSLVVG